MHWLAVSLLLMTAGCAQELGDLELTDQHGLVEPKLEFLGVAGVLIHWRDEGVLFDPFFSRPSIAELFWLKPDTHEIDLRMPPATDVSMLLVGHGHYDHLLDVAWIMRQHSPHATVYASRSAGHVLRAEIAADRVVNAEPRMASLSSDLPPRMIAKQDPWFYTQKGHIRAMPIESMHAPNALTRIMGGAYETDLTALPKGFWNWKEGQTLAWLVDLLGEDGKPIYRIHYQDSASSAPYGFPPVLDDGKSVDVEILPVASFQHADHYPRTLLAQTQPRLVVLVHWEDFVGGTPDDPRILRGQNDESLLVEQIKQSVPSGAQVITPHPFSEVALPAMGGR
ncbi:MAG TPA: MBL fold metallo-hydrolase [Pseudomonas sp.]|uniref:MBL fold metallo-hydrolase n=1 Tax=Pseudomonas sp. TaxID=306 RepID=UPI002ED8883A